jgi:hypothetical protein
VTAARRHRSPKVVAVVVALIVVVVIAVVAVVLHNSSNGSSGGHSVAELKSFAAKVPLPAGTTLADETSNETHGDLNSFLQLDYRLPDAARSSALIKAALANGDCQLVDLRSGKVEAVDSALWPTLTDADHGDVNVLPPGTDGGGLELNWQGAQLVLRVSGGDVTHAG